MSDQPVEKIICLLPRIPGIAGPASFQRRFTAGLEARGFAVTDDPDARGCAAILVSGGTRRLGALMRARRRGLPIYQRLDGINWIHRRASTGPKHYLRAEFNNLLLRVIRHLLADGLIYQSHFVQGWWERVYGSAAKPSWVIHNGVPLDDYRPDGLERPPADRIRVLMIEANLAGGYEIGLLWGVGLVKRLAKLSGSLVELAVAGNVPEEVRSGRKDDPGVHVDWLGILPPGQIASQARASHFLYSADLHPACPNAVIEALACGLPVVAFDTGALSELMDSESGRIVAYGGDPWRLEPPDLDRLAVSAWEVVKGGDLLRQAARRRAESSFSLDRMTQAYLHAMRLSSEGRWVP
jgi:glycosyltransferase involved in cell wall biosynthesis